MTAARTRRHTKKHTSRNVLFRRPAARYDSSSRDLPRCDMPCPPDSCSPFAITTSRSKRCDRSRSFASSERSQGFPVLNTIAIREE